MSAGVTAAGFKPARGVAGAGAANVGAANIGAAGAGFGKPFVNPFKGFQIGQFKAEKDFAKFADIFNQFVKKPAEQVDAILNDPQMFTAEHLTVGLSCLPSSLSEASLGHLLRIKNMRLQAALPNVLDPALVETRRQAALQLQAEVEKLNAQREELGKGEKQVNQDLSDLGRQIGEREKQAEAQKGVIGQQKVELTRLRGEIDHILAEQSTSLAGTDQLQVLLDKANEDKLNLATQKAARDKKVLFVRIGTVILGLLCLFGLNRKFSPPKVL